MSARLLALLTASVLLTASACPDHAQSRTAIAGQTGDYTLKFAGGSVQLLKSGVQVADYQAPGALPYQVVSDASPALVTTCGADLIPRTYVIGDAILQFENMLPQLVEPPVISLFSLSTDEATPGGRLVLIAPDGSVAWEHPQAQLLPPTVTDWPAAPVLAAPCSGSFAEPFGAIPTILAIDPVTGEEQWSVDTPAKAPPDDVELLCVSGGYGLLVLQYGYALFQYFALDMASGELTELYILPGQPAMLILQPGAMPAYRSLRAADGVAELLVIDEQQGPGLLTFDLTAGTAGFELQSLSGSATIEDNALPIGGGTADPDFPPYPQSLVPTEFGPEWTIPALVDAGRILLVTADGAQWIEY